MYRKKLPSFLFTHKCVGIDRNRSAFSPKIKENDRPIGIVLCLFSFISGNAPELIYIDRPLCLTFANFFEWENLEEVAVDLKAQVLVLFDVSERENFAE